MVSRPNTNKRGEVLLDLDTTIAVNHPDFRRMAKQAVAFSDPKWLSLLKRIDPIHILTALFLIGIGVTAYVQ